MKTCKNGRYFLFVFALLGIAFSSCKKDSDTTMAATSTFPAPISNIVSQSMIDSLRAAGTKIYDGTTPPAVKGIYLMHPDSCTYDNSPGNFTGTLFTDYKFSFTDQNNTAYTITVAQKDVNTGTLSSTPVSSYISGSGNSFSIFILRTLTPSGITVQQFNVLSGTLTATGIQNFQNTLYMRSKTGDPNNTVARAGTIRVFVTGGSGLAIVSASF